MSDKPKITVWVCVTCKKRDGDVILNPRAGEQMYDALSLIHDPRVQLKQVSCLNACAQSCAIAIQEPGKFGYIFGLCHPGADGEHVQQFTQLMDVYEASKTGEMKKITRPDAFKHNAVARIPAVLNIERDDIR